MLQPSSPMLWGKHALNQTSPSESEFQFHASEEVSLSPSAFVASNLKPVHSTPGSVGPGEDGIDQRVEGAEPSHLQAFSHVQQAKQQSPVDRQFVYPAKDNTVTKLVDQSISPRESSTVEVKPRRSVNGLLAQIDTLLPRERPVLHLPSQPYSSHAQSPSHSDTQASPAAATREVHVSIGRIEVKAHPIQQPPAKMPAQRGSSLSLDDYLARRRGVQQ